MFYTAIIMGLAGSLHCAGMCSPLAIAMARNKPFLRSALLYNSGRILLYSLLGTFSAAVGSFSHLFAYQQVISIGLGSLFLLGAMKMTTSRVPYMDRMVTAFTSNLKKIAGLIINQKWMPTTFALGLLNGMLPCGLTYFALSTCLILPSASDGFLFMLLFGLGTWPVMFGVAKLLDITSFKNKFSWSLLSRLAMAGIGFTLLIRGWWIHPHRIDLFTKPQEQVSVCK